jgi:hypothetical protein
MKKPRWQRRGYLNGGALQFAWSDSQTLIAQLSEGEPEYLGRFSFFARIGTTVAPMIAGVAWDLDGAWPSCQRCRWSFGSTRLTASIPL